MPDQTLDVDALLAPVYDAFPLAGTALNVARAEIRRLYPPVPSILRVYIAEAGSGESVVMLTDTLSIPARNLPHGATIAVDVSAACTLAFQFDGRFVRQESNPPYSIGGDAAGGKLLPWDQLTPGEHHLKVTPFDKPSGRPGTPFKVRFTIVADPVHVPPSDPPFHPPLVVLPPVNSGFDLPPLASGARQIYVCATGDDGNVGDSPIHALRTINQAMMKLRPAAGDRILLRAGDRFDAPIGSWRFSGVPGKPAGIFAYDDVSTVTSASRPMVAVRDASAINIDVPGVHDVAFIGLHLTAIDRNPADAAFNAASKSMYGIQALFPTTSVVIEDCRIDYFMYNVSFVAAANKGQHNNLLIRRCLLLDAWGLPSELFRGQGLYLESCRNVRIVECVLDHNGWIENAPGIKPTRNIYRHGAYINHLNVANVSFEANLASRNANYGVQLRCGGDVRQNFFFDNATCVGVGGDVAEVADNLFVGGHDTNQYGQGIAIELFSRRADVLRNVMLDHDGASHKYPGSRIHISRRPWTPAGDRIVSIVGNAIWGCDGPALRCDDALSELTFCDNVIQQARQQIACLDKPCVKTAVSGNVYDAAKIAFAHHQKKSQALTFVEWCKLTGDRSVMRQATVADANWRPDETFFLRARERPRGVWDASYDCREIVKAAQAAYRREPM